MERTLEYDQQVYEEKINFSVKGSTREVMTFLQENLLVGDKAAFYANNGDPHHIIKLENNWPYKTDVYAIKVWLGDWTVKNAKELRLRIEELQSMQ